MPSSDTPSRLIIRQGEPFTPKEQESAAQILRDGFWNCAFRFRAYNDHQALLELMRTRVKAAVPVGGLVLSFLSASSSDDRAPAGHGKDPVNKGGGDKGYGQMVGAVLISLPGEGFTQLQKNYGDVKSEEDAAQPSRVDETDIQRRSRLWVEQDLVPWFNDFSNRSLGPGGLENSLYISLFAVRRDYQGKGLGRDTMNPVMRWGDEKRWGMTLFDHEPELVKFYSSFGFEEVGRETRPCNGQDVTWWAMRRAKRIVA